MHDDMNSWSHEFMSALATASATALEAFSKLNLGLVAAWRAKASIDSVRPRLVAGLFPLLAVDSGRSFFSSLFIFFPFG